MHKHKDASVPQPYTIGRLRRGSAKPWGILLAGAAATTLLFLVPLLGFLLFLALWVLAFGMIAVSGLGASPHWLPTLFSPRAGQPDPLSPHSSGSR
jgi:hypothetical protein